MPSSQSIDRDGRRFDQEARRFSRPRQRREVQASKVFRAELVRNVGTPSTMQVVLIDQAVQLWLRLAVMDRRFVETRDTSLHDSRIYLAWASSLRRILRQLGLSSGIAVPPTSSSALAELLAMAASPASSAQWDGSDVRQAEQNEKQ
jgi:hypothetical protein